ncbi:MAG: hypothetical protein CPSOU_3029 [uncultured Paraburkholderia sp.]|nr:MAG: hypothetical protein CPSOU_3029 [uncultured Paraburkholderia sp.]
MKGVVAKRASASKVTFDSLIEAGVAWLAWIDGASRFEAILKTRIPSESLDAKEKTVIQGRLGTTSPESQLLLNSFYVTMVAGFEEFLRSAIRDLTNEISRQGLRYDEVDSAIIRMNIRESAKLLRRMDSPPDYLAFNEVDLCRGIGTCIPGSGKVELNPGALAEVDGLIKLENFMQRVCHAGQKPYLGLFRGAAGR